MSKRMLSRVTSRTLRTLEQVSLREVDIASLAICVTALEAVEDPNMQRANLEYLWDRFVVHPPKEPA